VLIGSRLPEILCSQFGLVAGIWLPLSQTIILLGLAVVAAKLRPIKNLAGFILAIAALKFSWDVVAPWIEASSVVQAVAQHLNWGGRFFLSRAIRTNGAVLMIITLFGSGIGRRDLFLAVGNWRAPVQREGFVFRRTISWTRLTMVLLLIFGVVLPLFLFITLLPNIRSAHVLLPLLPWAVVTSALNAANEEFQCRSVLLARLKGVVSLREAAFLTAVLFGLDHYFGQPSGWGGVLMAGVAGWIWAKSMFETRGFTCAFASHFVQDLVIFVFLLSIGASL
jgi:membrane protease YdiL (CAAX protease family)